MSSKLQLTLTQGQLDELTRAANAAMGTMCKVSKAALLAMIIDDGNMLEYIGKDNVIQAGEITTHD